MLPTNLNTNQIKSSTGTEVEFLFRQEVGRVREYMKSGESPAYPERILVQHQSVGKEGTFGQRRRSNLSVIKNVVSDVDNVTKVPIRASLTLDIPEGALNSLNSPKEVLAWLISGVASTGADTTIKFDCTGTLAEALLNGTL